MHPKGMTSTSLMLGLFLCLVCSSILAAMPPGYETINLCMGNSSCLKRMPEPAERRISRIHLMCCDQTTGALSRHTTWGPEKDSGWVREMSFFYGAWLYGFFDSFAKWSLLRTLEKQFSLGWKQVWHCSAEQAAKCA